LPISPVLWVLDSSILVSYLRSGKYRRFLLAGLERGIIFLAGVVLCELYAGATSREDRADLEALRRALGPHLLEAKVEDWVLAGRCLSYYSIRWGRIKPRDHLADVLVAVTALRVGAVLASEDLKQMRRWSWALGKLGRRLEVRGIKE
jgi:predicted nucleic acid-binding protein